MADRGRDVVLRVVSDETKFDLSDVVAELEDVDKEATDAARALDETTDELKRLAVQGQAAQRELDRLNTEAASNRFDELGQDAKSTARKVDDAFDAMARSAKTGMDKVEKDVEHAADEGFGEFKDEARSSGKEAAASFSGGFDDITDTVQEIAANAFAGFGPLGLAAGIAAAAGIGLITKMFGDAKEKAEQTKEAIAGWFDAIEEGGGKISAAGIGDKLKDIFTDADKFDDLSDKAKRTGIDITLLGRAMAGDADAAREVARRMGETSAALTRAAQSSTDLGSASGDQAIQLQKTFEAMQEVNGEITKATTQQAAYQAALAATNAAHTSGADAEAAHELAVQSLTDAQTAAQQAEADRQTALATLQTAIEEVGQAEITRKDGTVKSIDEIIAAQEKELKAKAEFERNTKAVFKAVGQAGVDWALAQGPNAAAAMKLLADAPKGKAKEIAANYTAAGEQAGAGVAAGLTDSKPKVVTAVDNLHASADAELAALGKLGIVVGVDGANISREAREAWAALDRYYQQHPITIPVKPGKRPVRDVV